MTARALALCLAIAVAAPACGDDAPPTGADTDTAQVVDADPDTGPAPDTTSDPDTSALPDADAGTDTDTDTVIAVDGAGDGHPPSCAVDADCDDGLACTVDRCTEARHCAWSVAAAACLVHAQCFAAGDARPGEPCQVCDPAAAPLAWTPRDDGAPDCPLILAVDYPTRADLDRALASQERIDSRAATQRALAGLFDGKIYHYVTDAQEHATV